MKKTRTNLTASKFDEIDKWHLTPCTVIEVLNNIDKWKQLGLIKESALSHDFLENKCFT